MLCLPIFIILLLFLSPAVSFPVESKLESLWTRMLSRDLGEEHQKNNRQSQAECCPPHIEPCTPCTIYKLNK
nr:conotoxin T M1.17 [Conus magus]